MLRASGASTFLTRISAGTSRSSAVSVMSPRSSINDMIPETLPALVTAQWLMEALSLQDRDSVPREQIALPGEARVYQITLLDASCELDLESHGYEKYYKRSHIPGAIFFDLHAFGQAKTKLSTNSLPFPEKSKFESFVSDLEITKDTHVIIYDSLDSRSAARAWFLFRLFGHERVSVLDGGIHQWQADGNQVCTAGRGSFCGSKKLAKPTSISTLSPQKYKADFRRSMLVDFDEMKEIVINKEAQVIDCRPETSQSDTDQAIILLDSSIMPSSFSAFRYYSAGHIPNAINIPYTSLFTPEGTFKSEEDLFKLFDTAGLDLSVPAVVYSELGMTSCCVVLAADLCGLVNLPIYNGSWAEWEKRTPASLKTG